MESAGRVGAAAVAIIKTEEIREKILVLRRVANPGDPWSGHFSFPGGRREAADTDLLATCIRETKEETGITLTPEDLRLRLELEPAGRNFNHPLWVRPFLFSLPEALPLRLDLREIASGCWLAIDEFLDPERHEEVEMLPGRRFPAFPLEDYYLWGFTYRLLKTILEDTPRRK